MKRPRTLLIAVEGLTREEAPRLSSLETLLACGSCATLSIPAVASRVAILGTAMTGAWPDQHGLLLPVTADGTTLRPGEACDRRFPAIWELLDRSGVASVAVGWPGTAGFRPDCGAVVDAGFGLGPQPEEIDSLLEECWMRPEEIRLEELAALVPQWRRVEQERDPRLAAVGEVIVHNVSRHAAFLELLETPWQFAAIVFSLPAELARLEAKSQKDGILEGLAERGLPLLDAFLAAILDHRHEEVRLVICGLPDIERNSGSTGFLLWDGCEMDGLRSVSLFDLAPALWRLHGFAKPPGLPGRALAMFPEDSSPLRDFPALHWRPGTATGQGGSTADGGKLTRWRIAWLQLQTDSLIARREWHEAVPLLEEQFELQPYSLAVLTRLTECQFFAGLHRDALETIRDAMALASPADPVPWLMAGGLEGVNGDLAAARRYFAAAVPLLPGNAAAALLHARILVHLRLWEEAQPVVSHLNAAQPDHAVALALLARIRLAQRDYAAACDSALRATALDSQNPEAFEGLGVALARLGWKREAWGAFLTAANLAPHWPRPWAWLAQLAKTAGKSEAEAARCAARYRETAAAWHARRATPSDAQNPGLSS